MLSIIPRLSIIPQPRIIETNNSNEGDQQTCSITTINVIPIIIRMESNDNRITDFVKMIFPMCHIKSNIDSETKGFLLSINNNEEFNLNKYIEVAGRKEGYILEVQSDNILIYSDFSQGLFYGIQTLRQLVDNYTEIPIMKITDWPDINMRGMNFDFRQLTPKLENILKYIEEFAKFKFNTLLIEYEDKLPFKQHKKLSHKEYSFTDQQFNLIKETARKNFIEIMPLQQSFGHLEYVLKHDEYKHLREIPTAVGELCPLKKGSYDISINLLDDMIAMHPDAKYIHIGCDEVWNMCVCEDCIREYGDNRGKAFIEFVNKIIAFVADKGKIPVMWHDMLAKSADEELLLLDKRVTVMIWLYGPFRGRLDRMCNLLNELNIDVIGASSIRGHDGRSDQNIPFAKRRIDNINEWMDCVGELKVNSIISTNWTTEYAMGSPYGVFENSLYLSAFSSEKYWNKGADQNSFMLRYLQVYHGVDIKNLENIEKLEKIEIPEKLEKSEKLEKLHKFQKPEDYYSIVCEILPLINKNKHIAELICILNELTLLMDKYRNVCSLTYRCLMYGDNEIEITSFNWRYNTIMERLEEFRPRLQNKLIEFMPESMATMFMNSRYMMIDYMNENFYKGIRE